MTIKITGKKALALLEQVVAVEGVDYVYEKPENSMSCRYVSNDTASCGVARALDNAGLDIKTLSNFDYLGPISSYLTPKNPSYTEDFKLRTEVDEKITLTKKAVQVFSAFQWLQDRRVPWGDCLENARLALQAKFDSQETGYGPNYIDVYAKYILLTNEDGFTNYFAPIS